MFRGNAGGGRIRPPALSRSARLFFKPVLEAGQMPRWSRRSDARGPRQKRPDGHFDAGQMQITPWRRSRRGRLFERVRPRHKRVVGAERADAVVSLGVIGRQRKIIRASWMALRYNASALSKTCCR